MSRSEVFQVPLGRAIWRLAREAFTRRPVPLIFLDVLADGRPELSAVHTLVPRQPRPRDVHVLPDRRVTRPER